MQALFIMVRLKVLGGVCGVSFVGLSKCLERIVAGMRQLTARRLLCGTKDHHHKSFSGVIPHPPVVPRSLTTLHRPLWLCHIGSVWVGGERSLGAPLEPFARAGRGRILL